MRPFMMLALGLLLSGAPAWANSQGVDGSWLELGQTPSSAFRLNEATLDIKPVPGVDLAVVVVGQRETLGSNVIEVERWAVPVEACTAGQGELHILGLDGREKVRVAFEMGAQNAGSLIGTVLCAALAKALESPEISGP